MERVDYKSCLAPQSHQEPICRHHYYLLSGNGRTLSALFLVKRAGRWPTCPVAQIQISHQWLYQTLSSPQSAGCYNCSIAQHKRQCFPSSNQQMRKKKSNRNQSSTISGSWWLTQKPRALKNLSSGIPQKYWRNASSLTHNSPMSRYHLHTGTCKCIGCSDRNSQYLRTVLHSCTFGLNKRSMKMLMSSQGRSNWAESVTKSSNDNMILTFTNPTSVLIIHIVALY